MVEFVPFSKRFLRKMVQNPPTFPPFVYKLKNKIPQSVIFKIVLLSGGGSYSIRCIQSYLFNYNTRPPRPTPTTTTPTTDAGLPIFLPGKQPGPNAHRNRSGTRTGNRHDTALKAHTGPPHPTQRTDDLRLLPPLVFYRPSVHLPPVERACSAPCSPLPSYVHTYLEPHGGCTIGRRMRYCFSSPATSYPH